MVLTGSGNAIESGLISTTTGTVTKTGTGTWTLTGTNTYTGAVTINAGILSVNNLQNAGTASSIGTGANTAAVTVAGSGTLQYTGSGHSTNRPIILSGTGATIDASGSGTMTLSGGVSGNTFGLVLTGSGNAIESGVISTTTGTVTKTGTGTWTLKGTNTYTGNTNITSGELRLNPSANITPNSQFILNGGTLGTTGITSGRTITNSSTLQLAANSTINLEANTHSLKFASSRGISWAGTSLTINGWAGMAGSSGTAGHIFIGNSSSGLTSTQLSSINFTGYNQGAQILSTGEVVPVVTPTTVEVYIGGVKKGGYTILKAAFDKINDGTHQGVIIIRINGSTTETASAILNASSSPASYTSVTIYPTASGLTIIGSMDDDPLIQLNGADNVILDGRVNQTGNADLLISNTATGNNARTIELINSAQNNNIQYCKIKGAGSGNTQGTINFSTAGTGTGNDGNTISYCNISGVSSTDRPVNAIYSYGTSGHENSGNTIQNNNIYDFFRLDFNFIGASNGIFISSYSTAFTITGNSFYETASSDAYTFCNYNVINIDNTSGNSFVVSGNYIGGSAASCSGTWTKTNFWFSTVFNGIYLNVGSTTASSIQNNIIKNITYVNTFVNDWYGINIAAGAVNIGTTTGNTIGAATGTGSITVTNNMTGGTVYGINIASMNTVVCQNNTIGSINATNTASNATNLYGINKTATAGTTTISNNTIGSTTTSNSLNVSSNSTDNAQSVYGISSAGTGIITINNNIVANLNNATTNATAATTGRINGILVLAGSTNTISVNTVRNLSIANANNTSGSTASVIGIALMGTIPTRTVSDNTIYSLTNTCTNYAGSIVGLYYEGSTSGTNTVQRNFIYGLTTPINGTTTGTKLIGILIASGVTTYANNIVNLGVSGTTNRNIMYGIYDTGTASQTCNLYFNTVYVAGNEAGSNISAALYSSANSNTRDYRNNIFFNARTGGTGRHYAIYYNYTSGGSITANYNNYFTTGTPSSLARFNVADDNTIPFITGQDANSLNTNPSFNSAGSTTASDYRVTTTLAGTFGTGITTDYGLNARSGINPTMGAWERTNKWKGTTSTDWNTVSNWSWNSVPPDNATIEFDAVPLNHCVMDQDRSVMSIVNTQSTYRVVTNGHKLTIKGNLQFTNGAQIDASSTSSMVEFAGTSAQSILSGSFYNNEVYNLIINNSANVILNGTLRLLNAITVTSGTLDAYTNSPAVSYAGTASQSIEDGRYLNNKIFNLTVDNSAGVILNTDFTVSNNLTINSGKSLTISVANQMLVQGTVSNNAGTTGLVIKSSSEVANGSFIFYNSSSNPVAATVEMYTKAFATYNTTVRAYTGYKWQYFGIPVTKVKTNPTFTGSYVRKFLESGTTISNHWVQLTSIDSVYSFLGYEITQANPKTIVFQGNLVNSDYSSGQLAYTPTALYPGEHILANPYTAAIDIRQINFGSQMEWSVYLYNSGSYNDWYSAGGGQIWGNNPGQYTAVPKNTAGYNGIPYLIPSMQGYLVKAQSSSANATLSIPYSSSMLKNTDMQRAPRKTMSSSTTEMTSSKIDVKGSRFSDRMWLFSNSSCTRNFDNGWDGHKSFTSSALMPQIFASEVDGNYQIDAVDNINNTEIGFYSGEDSIYTLTFTHENMNDTYPSIYLIDQQADKTIDVTESGTEYQFLVRPTDKLIKRFKIVTNSGISTETIAVMDKGLKIFSSGHSVFVHNFSSSVGKLFVYDISGQLILKQQVNPNGITTISMNLPIGVYLTKGIVDDKEITSRLILK